MKWINYHSHSQYCDGKEELSNYVEEAIRKGMLAYGFSAHAPMPFYTAWTIKSEALDEYISEAEQLKEYYKNSIQLYLGLEVDYIKNITGLHRFHDLNLDFTIGSIHFLGTFENGEYFGIDHTVEKFEKGLNEIFFGNIQQLVDFYYKRLVEMVVIDKPDIIGHFDIVKKFNKNNRFFNENDEWYRNIVYNALEQIAKTKCIIEVNTRGVLKKLCVDYYPSNWILKRCKQLNIPVTISADAHHPSEVDSFIPNVAENLLEIGYDEIMIFYDSKWQKAKFDKNGIIL